MADRIPSLYTDSLPCVGADSTWLFYSLSARGYRQHVSVTTWVFLQLPYTRSLEGKPACLYGSIQLLVNLKYVISTGSAFCASCTVLNSAFSTPVDDVATKRNLESSASWPSAWT